MTDAIAVLAPGQRVLDANGDPVPGARLRFFNAGTSTPKTVYADQELSVALGTVVYCDAGGYPVTTEGGSTKTLVYVGSADYKLSIEDEDGATLATHDEIAGAVDTSALAPEFAKAIEPVVSVTSSRAIATTDYGKLIQANSSAGSITLNLPAAATAGNGTRIRIRHTGTAGTVSVVAAGVELIDGPQASGPAYQLTRYGDEVTVVSTGAGWAAFALYIAAGSITAEQLSSAISGTFVQTGSILPWAAAGTLPTGYLECTGAAVSRTTYAELFAVIGTTYGSGDGSTTFNLPDYRGMFLRGLAGDATTDPDKTTRTDRGDGTGGNVVGSRQGDATRAHTHSAGTLATASAGNHSHTYGNAGGSSQVNSSAVNLSVADLDTGTTSTAGAHTHDITGATASTGGNETRPTNVYVRWIIFAGGVAATGASAILHTLLHGSGPPNDELGNNDDFYLDVDSYTIFGPKTDGSWSGTGYRFAMFPRGAWATETAYLVNDYVVSSGTSYVCIQAHTSGDTDDQPGVGATAATYWSVLAAKGDTGASGTDPGLRWGFDTSTTMGDPGTGELRLNNATLASVTELAISYLTGETGNPSAETYVKTWDDSTTTTNRGTLLLKRVSAPQNFAVFQVTSAITDNTTWGQFTVSHVASAGSLTGELSVQFYRTGNQGASGAGVGDLIAANNLSDVANAATARANLGLAIGTNVQAFDAELAAIAGLSSAADRLPYFTGSGTADLAVFSAFGRSLVDDAAAVNARTTLGLSIGADVQAHGAVLDHLRTLGASTADGQFLVATGANALAWESGATARASLGLAIGTDVQAYDVDLAALAGLSSAADRLPYFTGSGTAALATFTGFGRSLVDDADAAAARTTLGLVIGTDVQAYNARLADIAGVSWAQGDVVYYNGTNLVRLAPGSSGQFLRTNGAAANPDWATIPGGGDLLSTNNLSDVTNAATARTNLGLGSAAVLAEVTSSEWRSNTADRALSTDQVWSAMAEVTLTDAATIAVDLSTGFDFVVTLGDDRTLGDPTNVKVGQRGRIRVVQDGTGSHTLAYQANYEFAGGTAPVLSTAANAEDVLYYDCISATRILITIIKAIS